MSALQVLAEMCRKSAPLSRPCENVTKYPQVLVNTRVEHKVPLERLAKTRNLIRSSEKRLSDEGRILVRYSGTENLLRVMIEGRDIRSIRDMANFISRTAKKEIAQRG